MSASSPPTRVIAGVRLPAVGAWIIDAEYSSVWFRARRGALSTIRGRFGDVTGVIDIADDPSDSTIRAAVGVGSVRTGSTARDEVLRSIEHFDVDDHPTATFRSTRTRWAGRGARVTGALTMVGVTNEIDLHVTYRGMVTDRSGVQRSLFAVVGELDREAWGMTWNVTLDGGEKLIRRRVWVEIEVECVRRAPGTSSG